MLLYGSLDAWVLVCASPLRWVGMASWISEAVGSEMVMCTEDLSGRSLGLTPVEGKPSGQELCT